MAEYILLKAWQGLLMIKYHQVQLMSIKSQFSSQCKKTRDYVGSKMDFLVDTMVFFLFHIDLNKHYRFNLGTFILSASLELPGVPTIVDHLVLVVEKFFWKNVSVRHHHCLDAPILLLKTLTMMIIFYRTCLSLWNVWINLECHHFL